MKLILGLTTLLLATTVSFAYPLGDELKEEAKPAASVPLVNTNNDGPSKVEVVAAAPAADQPSSQPVAQPAPVVASDLSSSAESSASSESQESTERLEIAATTQQSPKLEESLSDEVVNAQGEVSNESKPQQDGENLATTEPQLPKLEEPKLEVINKPAVEMPIEKKPEDMPLLRSAPSAGNVESIKAEIAPAVPAASQPTLAEPAASDAIIAQPKAEIQQPELKKAEVAEPIAEALSAPLETASAPEAGKLAARSSIPTIAADEQPQPTQIVETVVVPEEAKISAKSSPVPSVLAEDPKISPVVEAISVVDAAAQNPVALAEEPVPLAKSDDAAAASSEELTTTERIIEEKPLALPTQQLQSSEDVKREVPLADSVVAVEAKEELVQPSEKKLEATPITAEEVMPSETKLVEEAVNKPLASETKIDEAKPIAAPSGDLKPQEPALVLAEEKPAAVELVSTDEKKKAKSDEISEPASLPLSTTEAQLSSTTIIAGVPTATTLEGLNAGNIVREEALPAQPISS